MYDKYLAYILVAVFFFKTLAKFAENVIFSKGFRGWLSDPNF